MKSKTAPARELNEIQNNSDWHNFTYAIERAKQSGESSGQLVIDHFADVSKMIEPGKGGQREVDDIMLTRYACYLIAQNADPKKEQIAFAANIFFIRRKYAEINFLFHSGLHTQL